MSITYYRIKEPFINIRRGGISANSGELILVERFPENSLRTLTNTLICSDEAASILILSLIDEERPAATAHFGGRKIFQVEGTEVKVVPGCVVEFMCDLELSDDLCLISGDGELKTLGEIKAMEGKGKDNENEKNV